MCPMSSRPLLAAFALTLAACSAVPQDEFEATTAREPIVGGTAATGYPEAALVNMSQKGIQVAICSGAVIAPQVVLTAGHCVVEYDGWTVRAPYAGNQYAKASGAATLDYTSTADTVDPKTHDVGLVFLATPIKLTTYPTIQKTKLASGSSIINVGRIKDGVASNTQLYASKPLTVKDATNYGYPFDYLANEIIQSGDSGGPDFSAGTHTIVAVNSGAGGGTEVLARVDLVSTWIAQQIASHGGSGTSSSPPPAPAPTCAHAICAQGAKLTTTCDPCAATVCAADAYCCTNSWDGVCVQEVGTLCGKACN